MNMMKNEHTEWTDRFSDYLDGNLVPTDFKVVEDHLAECGSCRRILEELGAVIASAGDLGDIEPPRDLWAGIAATIQAPIAAAPNEAKVIALPTASVGPIDADASVSDVFAPARFSFSVPQLAAASIVLIAASSLATWAAGPGLGVRPALDVAQVDASGSATMVAATALAAPPPELAEELAALEETLDRARAVLDPNTIRVLERNLGVIEQAIEDSRRALEQDPGNEFLVEHLDQVYRRKLTYLKDAARVAEWSS